MHYVSTRGAAPALDFGSVLLTGLAPDGGLYVPERWPERTSVDTTQSYADVAAACMAPFTAGSYDLDELRAMTSDAYATFDHPDVIPIVDLGGDLSLVELFHGPTLAFKDVAMQMLGRLFDAELARRNTTVTIVGATSGDTGSAAIEAFRDRENVRIVILHPHERTSAVQRRQMTTVDSPNVRNVAIGGTFDDCQDLVKAMFADVAFRDEVRLGAVNSINWARIMAQVVYYRWAADRVGGGESVSVTVPTGNFGNVFAGRVAQRLGAPIADFVVASNRNRILTQFFSEGAMTTNPVEPSLSPSMDIQVSSNLERLIFELVDGDGAAVAELMKTFRATGQLDLPEHARARATESWVGESVTDDETLELMRRRYETNGLVLDPHTAVGVEAAQRRRSDLKSVVMATAHPAKFPAAVEQATGIVPELPPRLSDLFERTERFAVLPPDLATVEAFVRMWPDAKTR